MNGDGRQDILGVAPFLTYAAGRPNGFFAPSVAIPLGTRTLQPGVLEDIDGDGDLDYFAFEQATSVVFGPSGGVLFMERTGEQEFALPVRIPGDSASGLFSLAFADVDGDGLRDLTYLRLVTGPGMSPFSEAVMHRRLPSGTLGPEQVLQRIAGGLTLETRVFWVDVESDGDADLMVAAYSTSGEDGIRWHENDGTGQLSAARIVEDRPQRRIRVFDDFNGDGRIDFVSYAAPPRRLRVTYGSATSASGFLPPETLIAGARARQQFTMDLDQDGDPDLVSLYLESQLELAMFENVNGMLSASPVILDSLGNGQLGYAAAGDQNGDGFEDLLLGGSLPGLQHRLYLGNGSGFDAPQLAPTAEVAGSIVGAAFDDGNRDGDDDLVLGVESNNVLQLRYYENRAEVGTLLCPGQVNSTGMGAELAVTGLDEVAKNRLVLTASGLPANASMFFLTSQTTGFTPGAGGSQGDLCLGGSIGRYVGPGQVLSSGDEGLGRLTLDLTQMPDPTAGLVAAAAGESWSFQAWYRDANPTVTSNFTAAQTVTLR